MTDDQATDVETVREMATIKDVPKLGRVVANAYITEDWQEGHLGPTLTLPAGMLIVLVGIICGRGFTNTQRTTFLSYTSDLKTVMAGLVLVPFCLPPFVLFAILDPKDLGPFLGTAIYLLLGWAVLGVGGMIASLLVLARGIKLKRRADKKKRPEGWATGIKVHRCWRVKWHVGSLATIDASGFDLVAAFESDHQPRHVCLRITAADDRLCYVYVRRYRFAHRHNKHYRQLYRHAP